MLSLLFLPLIYVFQKVFGRSLHHDTNSITYWIKFFAHRIVLYFSSKKGRFDTYDYINAQGDPYKLGVLAPKSEYEIDAPQSHEALEGKSDGVQVFATNSSGECLLARICRHQDLTAEVWLHLRMSDGTSYLIPNSIAVDQSEGDFYHAKNLRIQRTIPMRTWRVAYNGICRQLGGQSKNEEEVHLKFSFVCSTVSNVVDFSRYQDRNFLAHLLSTCKGFFTSPDRILSDVDAYTLPQYVKGTVRINGADEQELYMWGFRDIFRDQEKSNLRRCGQLLGFADCGLYLNVTELESSELQHRFTYGCMAFPSTQIRSLSDSSPVVQENEIGCRKTFKVSADRFCFDVNVQQEVESFTAVVRSDGKPEEVGVRIHPFQLDGNKGYAAFITSSSTAITDHPKPTVPDHLTPYRKVEDERKARYRYTLSFTDEQCREVEASGGKGASLAVLSALSKRRGSRFTVPKGIVVTTTAYELFSKDKGVKAAISELEDVAWARKEGQLQDVCKKTVQIVSDTGLPKDVEESIKNSLAGIYQEGFENVRFAVRSSASGEDSEEMSAAGQMETFLGNKGIEQILKAVTKCWASQFSYVACEYKRRYGQILNSPMAVVIQEMAPSDIAGVMFTCDPVTNDPRKIVITANYGLGESVVSASADPDTVTLFRTLGNKLSVSSTQVGAKKLKIVMQENGGTREEASPEENSDSCLSEEQALRLGYIGVEIEQEFMGSRDIEWAFVQDKIYLLQSRPVTSVYQETDFEIIREFDAGLSGECTCLSKANVGEVMKGASSPLSIACVFPLFSLYQRRMGAGANCDSLTNPYSPIFGVPGCHHMFFAATNEIFDSGGQDMISKGYNVSLSGRIMDNEDVLKYSEIMSKYKCKSGSFVNLSEAIKNIYRCENNLNREYIRFADKTIPVFHLKSPDTILLVIANHWDEFTRPLISHADCIQYSTMFNILVLTILSHTTGDWNTPVFSDFAKLVSSCKDLVSVGVPSDLQDISVAISKDKAVSKFKDLRPEEALKWLEESPSEIGVKFREFLKNHGHRCVNEFDVRNKPWEEDSLPVVKTLQTMAGVVNAYDKKELTVAEAISQMEIKLNPARKMCLRLIMDKCRKGAGLREKAKSLLVKSVNILRKSYRHLAKTLLQEGRIPDADLMFFLTFEEIRQLTETRSPRLLAKAARRRRLYPYLDSLRFPEIVRGPPRPINIQANDDHSDGKKSMKGTPVSPGTIVGTACVVNDLPEAVNIQRGDILITYCTDIGWSPYFPLLSGVVTELGGLISHGAVVAREYGLPCVVGLHGATSVFKSGEKVRLDGTKGILETVE